MAIRPIDNRVVLTYYIFEVINLEERNIHTIMLEQYSRRLYATAGEINLYISLCCKKDKLNIKKLESDIQLIKELVVNIENEIYNI